MQINQSSVFQLLQKTYKNNIVSKDNCIAQHNEKLCFLLDCTHHFIIKGDIEELLQKLYAPCFT